MKSVITGASGEIGGAIARAFAKRGDNLALLYRSDEKAARALAEEVAACGAMVVVKNNNEKDITRNSCRLHRPVCPCTNTCNSSS